MLNVYEDDHATRVDHGGAFGDAWVVAFEAPKRNVSFRRVILRCPSQRMFPLDVLNSSKYVFASQSGLISYRTTRPSF